MRLSIVVPAYNEEARIGPMLDAYLPYFSDRYGADAEILIVINGTTDRTEDIVRGYEARYPMLRHRVDPRPIGKGGALMLGFREARGDWVGFVDADGSTPPEAFQDLVERIGDAGALIASRWCRGAEISPRQPLSRRIASRIFNMMVGLLFGLRLTDTQCGAKLMKREAVLKVLPHLGITRWAFDVDLLFQLKRAGYRVREIPTVWHDVVGSKIEIARVSTEMAVALIRLRLLYSPFRWIVSLYDRFLQPFIHPAGVESDRLFRHSFLLMAGGQVVNVCNLLFQSATMRMLSHAEYGTLAAMIGIFVMVGMPLGSFAGTATHFSANFLKQGHVGRVKFMIRRFNRDLTLGTIILVCAALAGCQWVVGFLKLDSAWPFLVTVGGLCFSLYRPAYEGALMGAEAFVRASVIGISWGVSRFGLAVLFMAVGWQSVGALTANSVSFLIALVVAAFSLRSLLGPGRAEPCRLDGVYSYFARYMLAMLGYAVLMSADVVLVKHFFSPDEAGQFSVAAIAARMVVFLPQPILGAMFPKVVSSGEASQKTGRTLAKALVLVGLLVLGVALMCSFFPVFTLRILGGKRLPELAPVLRAIVWALCPVAILQVIVNFELAQRRFAVTVPLLLCAAGYIVGVMVWHGTFYQVIAVLAVSGSLALAAAVALVPWHAMQGAAEPRGKEA